MARTNIDAQQTAEPVDPNRPANLFAPVPEDPGAHGRFDRRSHARSAQSWCSLHRRALGLTGLAAAFTLGLLERR